MRDGTMTIDRAARPSHPLAFGLHRARPRREALLALLLSIIVLGCDLRGSPASDDAQGERPPDERPYSVQLHVHGSFSEGLGSHDSQSFEAADAGVDALWWSDHDFRIASLGHASSFGFEDWRERMPSDASLAIESSQRGRRGSTEVALDRRGSRASGTAEFVTGDAREGQRSLRVQAESPSPDFAAYRFSIDATRALFKRPLASRITLRLAIFAEQLGPDAAVTVEIALSEHAPREGLGLEPYMLRYVLDNEHAEPRRVGSTFVIPLRFAAGVWNDLELPITDDAIRGFPFIHGEDNSLREIFFAVEARRGATAAARFDALRIEQQLAGSDAFAIQRDLMLAVGRDYRGVTQLQGVEASWIGRHVNEFSVDTRLVDYATLLDDARRLGPDLPLRDRITQLVVEDIHSRGGLASYNHMYGTMMEGKSARASREEVLAELLAHRVFGADILEVGYRDRGGHSLADHLWVWDQLGANGIFPVATGVSDSHGGPGQRWRTSANNFVSWIFGRSTEKADLLDGLRAGRVFFGDLLLFNGSVDLLDDRGHRMGQIVLTDVTSTKVTLTIDGLASGDRVQLIVNGRAARSWAVPTPAPSVYQQTIELDPVAPTIVRCEVYAEDGTAKVLSNAIVYLRAHHDDALWNGVPAARAAIVLGQLASRSVTGLTVTDARSPAPGRFEILGRASNGSIELVCPDCTAEPEVEFIGFGGSSAYAGDTRRLTIRNLTGAGSIKIALDLPSATDK